MINIVKLRGASFYAYHGALKEEQNIGGKFEVDIDMYTDFSEAAKHDNLKKTIDYTEVYKYINEIINKKKYYLIETIAMEITNTILHYYPNVYKVRTLVIKKSVPVGGLIDHVEVEVIKENEKS